MKKWDPEQLWLKARAYFDKANNVEHSNPEFALWSSLGLELLARAALTNVHPVLNADPRDDFNLLYACGFEVAGQPRSLPAHSVFLRLEKIIPGFGKVQRELCDFLGHLRNQELHSAELPFDNLKESKWLPRFYEVCQILCKSMSKTLEDLFGSKVAAAGGKLINTLTREVEAAVKARVADHARVFSDKTEAEKEKLQTEAAAAVLRLFVGRKREQCPACKVDGVLTGDLIKELPPVYVDDYLVVDQEYIAERFECLACGLVLRNVEEITTAGLEPRFTDRTETSLHELYEPDFVEEYDNM